MTISQKDAYRSADLSFRDTFERENVEGEDLLYRTVHVKSRGTGLVGIGRSLWRRNGKMCGGKNPEPGYISATVLALDNLYEKGYRYEDLKIPKRKEKSDG